MHLKGHIYHRLVLGLLTLLMLTNGFGCGEIKTDPTRLHGHTADTLFRYDPKIGELAKAAATGNLCEIERLVKVEGINVNGSTAPDAMFTPLGWAVQAGNIEGIKKLIELGADPNYPLVYPDMFTNWTTPGTTMTPLYVGADNYEVVKVLLEAGADPNGRSAEEDDYYRLALFDAMGAYENCRLENVKLLVEYGADVNLKQGLTTPLTEAILGECYEIAQYLLDRGANTDLDKAYGFLKFNKRTKDGWKDGSTKQYYDDQTDLGYQLEVILYNMGARYYPAQSTEEGRLIREGYEINRYNPRRMMDIKPGEYAPAYHPDPTPTLKGN